MQGEVINSYMQIKDRNIYEKEYLHICKYIGRGNLFIYSNI